jgi:hypothetical protein
MQIVNARPQTEALNLVLPERRRDPKRITDQSVLNWAKEVIGNGCHEQSIYFVEVNQGATQSRN